MHAQKLLPSITLQLVRKESVKRTHLTITVTDKVEYKAWQLFVDMMHLIFQSVVQC